MMNELFVERWGTGTPVVLVHGSLATGQDEWQMQRPLAEAGYQLVVPDRRGYGASPPAVGEDFLRDADDLKCLTRDAAHLVGHSYGGLGVLLAAAARPHAARSIVLLEPAVFELSQDHPAAQVLTRELMGIWETQLSDEQWVIRFLQLVGSEPESLSPELIASAVDLVPVFRRGRPIWKSAIPFETLRMARFPKLVVSGGHSTAFEAICDGLAARIGAERAVVTGAGHEVQFAGQYINEVLVRFWQRADQRATREKMLV